MNFDSIPVWLIFVATVIGVIVAIEAGFQLGHQRRRKSEDVKEAPISAITGAILGLAAFMLAFTFSIVASRHDAKRTLVREEAVAIRTAWHRADFLPEPQRAETATLLRQYLDSRIRLAEAGSMEPEHVNAGLAEAQTLQDRIWNVAVANARKDTNSELAALYLESLNKMNGIHTMRVAVGVQAKIPPAIWLALYFLTVLAMLSVGYQTGIAGSRRSMTWHNLALAFALVFTLIGALDRPDSGIMKVSQQPLIDLRDAMDTRKG